MSQASSTPDDYRQAIAALLAEWIPPEKHDRSMLNVALGAQRRLAGAQREGNESEAQVL